MTRAVKIATVLVCIVCLLALCIAPWVDPPETILKALQVVLLLMSALVVGLFMQAEILPLQLQLFASMTRSNPLPIQGLLLPRETNCVQQC
jgi:hypothetical protein